MARLQIRTIIVASAVVSALSVIAFVVAAPRDARWKADPGDGIYDNPANWSSGAVPDGTASFGASARRDITFTRKRIARYTYPDDFALFREGWISAGGWSFDQAAGSYQVRIGPASYPIDATPRVPCTGERLRFTGAGIAVRAGAVSIINDSCLAFVSRSSAGSAAITKNKWLEFRGAATAGNASIINSNVLRFFGSTAQTASITNNFELEFRSNSTAADAAILNNGRAWFLESSTGGNAAISNVAPNAIVIFDRASVSLGSIVGGGKLDLGQARLSIGGNNRSTTFDGAISDRESRNDREASLVKVGTGALTLAGANSYVGSTSVVGGVLAVDGSIAASRLTTVQSGGTLAGTGTVGHTQVNAGGILAPGAAELPAALNVSGNLYFQPGAVYAVRVDPSAAASVRITGHASPHDATVDLAFAPGTYVARTYKIMESGGKIAGRFAPAVTTRNLPADLKAELNYQDQEVQVVLSRVGPPTTGADRN